MKEKLEMINKKSITIYTIVMILLAIVVFEIGYCNTAWLKDMFTNKEWVTYRFSLCRIVFYVLSLVLYIIFRKGFIKEALEVAKNKYKRVFIYLTIIAVLCSIIFAIIICHQDTYLIRTMSIGLITAFLGSLLIIYLSNHPIRNVIVIACTLGIVFTFTTNYNHAIDEKKHFMSALNVSFLNFDYDKNPITDIGIEQLPQLSKYTIIDPFFEPYTKNLTTEVNKEDVPSTPASYHFLTYAFPAIGIAIARGLQGSIMDMYILGRVMNLCFYTFLICIALKLLPYKKNVFFVLAMMPYALLLAASYSIDGFCIGAVFIFVAYCLKICKENETISLKQFLILVGLFGFVLLAKSMAYVLVGFVVFLLPLWKTIKKNKKYIPIMVIVAIILCILAVFLAFYIKNTKLVEDARATGEINSAKQLELLLTNPVHDIKLLMEHTKNSLLSFQWYEMLHYEIFFTKDAKFVMLPLMLFILYVALTESEHHFKTKEKIIMLISFLMVWGMTSMALYLSFTQVGALYVAGYQTRYIMPVLPLVLVCISNSKVEGKQTQNRNLNIAIITSIFLVIGIAKLIVV